MRRKNRPVLFGSLILALSMGILACGCKKKSETTPAKTAKVSPSAQEAPSKAKPQSLHLAFVTNNASNFWAIARRGVEKAEKELGVKTEFRIPANGTATEQQQIVEDLIAKGCKGMAISPVDPTNQTFMLNQAAEAMVVICHDSDAPESNRRCYIGTNNYVAGKEAGKLIREVLPQGGKIMLFVGTLDAQNARDRRKGILDELDGSDIVVVDTRTDLTDRARAKSNVEETLIKHADIGCLVGLWSYNGPAIAEAVQDANMAGKVHVVCFDEDDSTLQAIQDEVIYGTVVQKPFEFGYQSIHVLVNLLSGDDSIVPEDGIIDTGVTLVKKDNVEAFWAQLKEMIGNKG